MLEMTISGFEEEEEEGKPHNLDVITELILSSNQISRFASDHLPTRYDKIRKSGQFKAAFSPISEGLINYLQAQGVCSGRQSTENVDRKGDRYTPQLHQVSRQRNRGHRHHTSDKSKSVDLGGKGWSAATGQAST